MWANGGISQNLAFLWGWRMWIVQQLSGAAPVSFWKIVGDRQFKVTNSLSFYRRIDSWFLWLLIEIPSNSSRFQRCFSEIVFVCLLEASSTTTLLHAILFWVQIFKWLSFRTAENRRLQIAPIRPQGAILNRTRVKPVGGCVILLMVAILHQLRLVVYPTIYKVLYIPGGAGGDPFLQWTMIMGGRVRIHPTSCRISSINSILPVCWSDWFSRLVSVVYFVRCHGWPLCCQSFLGGVVSGKTKVQDFHDLFRGIWEGEGCFRESWFGCQS